MTNGKEMKRGNPVRKEIEMLIKAEDVRGLLDKAGELHGHFCNYLAYGVMAGYIAVRELGIHSTGMEEVIAILETNNCFSDGIQMITGCSFGNNALIYRDFGKTAATLAKRDGTAIRIALNPDFEDSREQEYPEAYELWDKIVAQREQATPEEYQRMMALFAKMSVKELSKSEDEVFNIEHLEISLPEYAPMFESVRCFMCGENVMASKVVERDGEKFCIPCAKDRFSQLDGGGIRQLKAENE
jgi:formylmethanofuran dehydrogenase subunit E